MHPIVVQDVVRARHEDDLRRARWAGLASAGRRASAGATQPWSAPTPRRTLATAATIEATFALAWFGWGQDGPPAVRAAGFVLALSVAVAGLASAVHCRAEPTPIPGSASARMYRTVVGAEFVAAGVGAVALGAIGAERFVAAWVCLVIGIHLVALKYLFHGRGMEYLATATSLVGVSEFVVAGTGVLPSAVTGCGAGLCVLVHAGSMLLVAHRRLPDGATGAARALKMLYTPPVLRSLPPPTGSGDPSASTPASARPDHTCRC